MGSRKATAYGVQTAGRFAKGLAEEGVTIVSGGARGIDSASHEGALEGKAPTIVVAAFGLDRVYPPENRNLFIKSWKKGAPLFPNTLWERLLWEGSFLQEIESLPVCAGVLS